MNELSADKIEAHLDGELEELILFNSLDILY